MRNQIIGAGLLACALLLSSTFTARATDVSDIPWEKLDQKTVMVMRLDIAGISMDQVRAAVRTLAPQVVKMAEPGIKQSELSLARAKTAGVKAMYITVAGNPASEDDAPSLTLYFKHDANLSPDDLRKLVRDTLAPPEEQDADVEVDLDNVAVEKVVAGWTVIYDTETGKPNPGLDAGAAGQLREAFGHIEGNPAVSFAMVMTPEMRKTLAEEPKEVPGADADDDPVDPTIAKLGNAAAKLKYSWAALYLGQRPRITSHIVMPDAESAQKVFEALSAVRDEMAKTTQQAGPDGGGTEMAVATMMLRLFQVKGAELTWDLTTEQLVGMAQLVVPAVTGAQAKAQRAGAMNQMRQLLIAMIQYANDNDGAAPDKLEDIKPYFGDDAMFDKMLTHPSTGEKPGFIYVKPKGKLLEAGADTVLLYEARNGKKAKRGALGYADGHVARAKPTADKSN
ncbi:MAG: hypothetical protein GC159_23135 [Phycisphaera sp.]|nr:hypothetical protein [Phycisphaera sp.]